MSLRKNIKKEFLGSDFMKEKFYWRSSLSQDLFIILGLLASLEDSESFEELDKMYSICFNQLTIFYKSCLVNLCEKSIERSVKDV